MDETLLDQQNNKKTNFNSNSISKVEPLEFSEFQAIDPNDEVLAYDHIWNEKSIFSKLCYYAFCLCFCEVEENKDNYKTGWQNYLEKENEMRIDLPFRILTSLYAQDEQVLEQIKNIRLNPNLVNSYQLRNDLEFYIPQLCTFLLYGKINSIEKFKELLYKICKTSFFFGHRVHWFLSAMLNNNIGEKRETIIEMLNMITSLYKTDNEKKKNKISEF